MEETSRPRRGALAAGIATALCAAIAIFGLGVAAWLLFPATLIAGTAYAERDIRASRRLERS